jgi:hypothetical protein
MNLCLGKSVKTLLSDRYYILGKEERMAIPCHVCLSYLKIFENPAKQPDGFESSNSDPSSLNQTDDSFPKLELDRKLTPVNSNDLFLHSNGGSSQNESGVSSSHWRTRRTCASLSSMSSDSISGLVLWVQGDAASRDQIYDLIDRDLSRSSKGNEPIGKWTKRCESTESVSLPQFIYM